MSNESHEGSSPLSYGEGPGVRSEKRCSRCGETKPIDAFHKSKREKSGHQYHCKACSAAYQAANWDKRLAQKRARYAANPDKYREYDRALYAANIHKIRAYRAANRDKLRARSRAWKVANRDKLRAWNRAWKAANPDLDLINVHRRLALKKANGGDGFTVSQLKHMRATQGGECAYCMGLYHPHALTIDHIIPIAQRGRHEAANICLACPKCNFTKGNRTPDQWLNRWYWDWRLREPEYIPPHWY